MLKVYQFFLTIHNKLIAPMKLKNDVEDKV